MKSHKFDVKDAKEFGVNKAIILQHLKFHQENNEGMEEYTFEGKPYCHARLTTLSNMYPYFSKSSISRWLKEMEDNEIVETFKPKSKNGDHTKYYHVIGHEGNSQNGSSARVGSSQNGSSKISQNGSSSYNQLSEDYIGEYTPSEKPPEYHIPTAEQVEAYFQQQEEILLSDIPQEALKFCNHYEDAEWKNGRGKRIKNWHLQAGSWAANYKQWNRDRISEEKKRNQNPNYGMAGAGAFSNDYTNVQ